MPATNTDRELLTPRSVATEVHVTPRTVRIWVNRALLPALRTPKGWLIERRALEEFLRSGARA